MDFYQTNYCCLELQDFIMPDNLTVHREQLIEQYQLLLQNYPGIITIHGPYIDLHCISLDPLVSHVCLQRYEQALEVATALKAPYVVFHSHYEPRDDYSGYDHYFVEQNIHFWKKLIKKFEKAEIIAVIENIHDKNALMIKQILQEINSPYLGACLDTGHAFALGKSHLNSWIEQYGSFLRYVHLHDNNGLRDEHLPIGWGKIDLSTFLKKLQEVNYNSVVICEIFEDIHVQRENLQRLRKVLKGKF